MNIRIHSLLSLQVLPPCWQLPHLWLHPGSVPIVNCRLDFRCPKVTAHLDIPTEGITFSSCPFSGFPISVTAAISPSVAQAREPCALLWPLRFPHLRVVSLLPPVSLLPLQLGYRMDVILPGSPDPKRAQQNHHPVIKTWIPPFI